MTEGERSTDAESTRIKRERKTVGIMIGIYCKGNHRAGAGGVKELCQECTDLKKYANRKLDLCPYGEGKSSCLKCSIHCYGEKERERIRQVMRYAGPRMLLRHPVMAIRHILDGRRTTQILSRRTGDDGE